MQSTLSKKELRQFGLILAAVFIAVFGMFIPWFKQHPTPHWPWAFAGTLLVLASLLPTSLILIYRPWMKLGNLLGWVNTRIILGLLFFVVITPMGWVLRLMKYDPLQRTLEPQKSTYRIDSDKPTHQHMEKPF